METMRIEQNDQFSLTRPFLILLKRKWLILLCLIGVLVSVVTLNSIAPKIYQAYTTIIFEEQKGPGASINPFKISLTKSFIINQIEEIKSRSLADEVIKELPESIINTFPLPKNPEPGFDRQNYIAKRVQKNISAKSITNSEIIKIEVQAYSPIAAQVIANTIAEVLKKRNLDVRREETDNVKEIIEAQLLTFKKQLDDAEITLKQFKEQSNVTIIDKEAEEIFKRITEAEVVYNKAKTNLDAAQKRLTVIQDKLAAERKDLVPTITKVTSPWAQKLKQQLVELEFQYTTLKVGDYSEDHPKMQLLRKQIEETKENLKKESLKIASGENIIDPIAQIQKFMEESISLDIEIQTYQAQEKALKEFIEGYKRNLNTLPDKELRLAQLLRDREVNEKIYMMLLQKREEAKIAEAERVGNIRIIDYARMPEKPIKPRKALNLIIGIILGSLMGTGLTFLLEYVDTSVKTVEEAEQITKLSVLGAIPQIRTKVKNISSKNIKNESEKRKISEKISKLITLHDQKSPEAETFRTLRTNLKFASDELSSKAFLITSSNPTEGKSIIAANLSITSAQMGLRTLLIDADLRKPVLHQLFQREKVPGLVDFLSGDKEIIFSTDIPNLSLLTAGNIPPNHLEILTSDAMKNMLVQFKNEYDTIFVDTPPISLFSDAGVLSSIIDGSLLVIKAGESSKKDLLRAKSLLEKARSKIVGVVINFSDAQDGYLKHYYYYYFSDNNDGKKIKKFRRSHKV